MDNLFVHQLLRLYLRIMSRLYRHIRQAAIPARVVWGTATRRALLIYVDFCVKPASVIWTLAGECSAFCLCVQRECVFMLRGRYVL